MWVLIVIYIVAIRPKSGLLNIETGDRNRKHFIGASVSCAVCLMTVLACILPMGLSPVEIGMAFERYEFDKFEGLNVDICIGCGCCSYVCPAKRPLTEVMTLSKGILKKSGKGGKK